jgi:DNA invertase Pin-like site-specific DNA recombinase
MTASKKKPATATRAVCYVRISKDRENETSTETQEERLRAYCAAHGWDVVKVIVEPGRSAYKSTRGTRPGFREAMGLVQAGAADALVVWKIDRAARNTEDTLGLVRELDGHGARFVSVTEQFDTSTASGRMMLTVLAALAEMESATKSERVQVWQDRRRATGATPTGPRPFGYRRERNTLHVVDDEAALVRRLADEVLAGKPLRAIARDLGTVGIRNGKPMTPRTIRAILTGPTIAGCREVEPGVFVSSDQWEPILPRATWDEVRAYVFDPARRSSTTGPARRWLLTGIATCGRCLDERSERVTLASKPHKQGPRYSCPKCHLSIEAARTDEAVEQAVLGELDKRAWRRLRRGQSTTVDTSWFEEAMAKVTARFMAGDIDADELAMEADGLRRQQDEVASVPPEQLPDVDDIQKAWEAGELTVQQRRLVLTQATKPTTLVIRPWTPTPGRRNGFDRTRIEWVAAAA